MIADKFVDLYARNSGLRVLSHLAKLENLIAADAERLG